MKLSKSADARIAIFFDKKEMESLEEGQYVTIVREENELVVRRFYGAVKSKVRGVSKVRRSSDDIWMVNGPPEILPVDSFRARDVSGAWINGELRVNLPDWVFEKRNYKPTSRARSVTANEESHTELSKAMRIINRALQAGIAEVRIKNNQLELTVKITLR